MSSTIRMASGLVTNNIHIQAAYTYYLFCIILYGPVL